MTFTDDYFKRMKGFIDVAFQPHTAWDVNEMRDLVLALLARLEAAEHCLLDGGLTEKEKDERFKAWRKAAGREGAK